MIAPLPSPGLTAVKPGDNSDGALQQLFSSIFRLLFATI
jgi:hypothetical protein